MWYIDEYCQVKKVLLTTTHYVYKRHHSTESFFYSNLTTMGMTKKLSMEIRDKNVYLHKDEMSFKAISKQLSEKVTYVGVIIHKWKKHKKTNNRSRCGEPCKILPYGLKDDSVKSEGSA